MIVSNKELKFYLMADYMMNRGRFKPSLKNRIINFFYPDDIIRFLRLMRKASYYHNVKSYKQYFYKWLYNRQSRKLGFSIGFNVFGYGLVIPHYGTIVVGGSNRIGNYAVLHTSTCISDNGKIIGDSLYFATGAKMTSKIKLGDNISVGANSVVNKSFEDGNIMIAGAPAIKIKDAEAWFIRDGIDIQKRVEAVEDLKKRMNIE